MARGWLCAATFFIAGKRVNVGTTNELHFYSTKEMYVACKVLEARFGRPQAFTRAKVRANRGAPAKMSKRLSKACKRRYLSREDEPTEVRASGTQTTEQT